MRILFIGKFDYGGVCLARLIDEEREIVGVVTQPLKKAGDWNRVIDLSEEHDLNLFTIQKIDSRLMDEVRELQPDVMLLASFGLILPERFITLAKHGCINCHPSLLPKYRGSTPIHWAIINGEIKTGVTSFFINEGIDTGDIILQREIAIDQDDTLSSMVPKLSHLAADVMMETAKLVETGTCPRKTQTKTGTYYPRCTHLHGRIDWSTSSRAIHDQIRGMYKSPGAFTRFDGKTIFICRAPSIPGVDKSKSGKPGTFSFSDGYKILIVNTGDGQLSITRIRLEGAEETDCALFEEMVGESVRLFDPEVDEEARISGVSDTGRMYRL